MDALSEKIIALLEQAETLGAQGRVDEAQKLIEKSEQFKEERDEYQKVSYFQKTVCWCFNPPLVFRQWKRRHHQI